MGEHRLAELLDGARATSEQDVAVLVGECKRLKASEARLVEALKQWDRLPMYDSDMPTDGSYWVDRSELAEVEHLARAALKGAE